MWQVPDRSVDVVAELRAHGDGAVPDHVRPASFSGALHDENSDVRHAAAALRGLDDPREVEPLVAADLADLDDTFRAGQR